VTFQARGQQRPARRCGRTQTGPRYRAV